MSDGVRKSFTGGTKKEAELMALEWQNGKRKTPTEKTIGEIVQNYIDIKSNVLSPKTVSNYRQLLRLDIAAIADMRVSDITQSKIQVFVNEMATRKSPKSVKNAHGLLVAALNVYAPDIRLRTQLPPKQKVIKVFPRCDDVIAAIVGTDVELPCMLAIWQGMRLSEILGAKKSDIVDNVLTISEVIVTVDGKQVKKDATKTYDSKRILELPEYIMDLIKKLPENQNYLTTLKGSNIYKKFTKLLKKNNLKHMSFHDLRHLNASTMLALGIPDKYAMERGGWSSTNIIKSVYQHTLTEERKKNDKIINDYFLFMINGSHEISHTNEK